MNIMKVTSFMNSKKIKRNHIFKSTRDHIIFEFFKLVFYYMKEKNTRSLFYKQRFIALAMCDGVIDNF